MNEDFQPLNKKGLLAVIDEERRALDSLFEHLSINQMCTPGVESFWSIKDIMAHITAWERLALDRIHSALTGEALKYPVIEGDNFIDDFNADVYEENKDTPLDMVEHDYKASHEELVDQIKSLDDGFLNSMLPFDWAGELTAMVFISANTHWHYLEHAAAIRNWLSTC